MVVKVQMMVNRWECKRADTQIGLRTALVMTGKASSDKSVIPPAFLPFYYLKFFGISFIRISQCESQAFFMFYTHLSLIR